MVDDPYPLLYTQKKTGEVDDMANGEHLEIIQQGTDAWNKWREKHPEATPDLSFADLNNATLNGAHLSFVNFDNANLSFANFSFANLSDAHLRNTDFTNAILSFADLSDADLNNATLNGAHLSRATLNQADLSFADLRFIKFDNADLSSANLSSANLSSANFYNTNLINTTLSGANFTNARVARTIFGDVDLREAKGLENIKHEGPSTIGMDTLMRSEGDIPVSFLKGAGVSDILIEYAKSLVGRAIDYYTCFISYSSQNHNFAERLYADLQHKGVRCWFAPEDMKTGNVIRDRIDQSIRLYDKLLLVLSEHSVQSKWVRFEVEAALDKEHEGKPPVLFPVRLDDAVLNSSNSWAAHIQRTRHITDFSQWKQHDDYQRAFTRLLHDLQPEKA